MTTGSPYFGVTGFTSPEDVDNVLDSYTTGAFRNPHLGDRRMMVGVLVNEDTLGGKASRFCTKRYPPTERIASIFEAAAKKTQHATPSDIWPDRGLGPVRDLSQRTIRLIHYSSRDPNLHRQLDQLTEIAGRHLDGFQLNIAWPSRTDLSLWKVDREKMRLVIQINRHMFNEVNRDPEKLCDALDLNYSGLMTDLLFDLSGGEGMQIDLKEAEIALATLYERFGDSCGIGIAGGLDHSSVAGLKPLFERFPTLSIDTESRVRDKEDNLSGELARYYLRNAFGVLPKDR